jgi:hypothetical protein
MKVHGEAVYNTVPYWQHEDGNIIYLQSKDKGFLYVYVLSGKNNDVVLPQFISLKNIRLKKGSRVIFMDAPKEKIKWRAGDNETVLEIPASLQNKTAGNYAVAFKVAL